MRGLVAGLVISLLLCSCVDGLRSRFGGNNAVKRPSGSSRADYETLYFTQTLDHFNFQVGQTFQQRYLVNDQYFGSKNLSVECAGPILFYTGNEGDVTEFYDNSGFITDVLAPELGGLIVFAEHRYYGESLPFGPASFEVPNVGYLSTEQALADFAVLIRYLKYESPWASTAMNCPVIAFGGSYGGMLSAWLRMKYPNSVAGALASSAPIGWFYGAGVEDLQYVYAKIVTQDYEAISPQCSGNIASAFAQMQILGESTSGQTQLQEIFHLCRAPSTPDLLYAFLGFVEGAFDTMAQYDYPYAATFAGDLPAWPVQAACNYILQANPNNTTSLLTSIYNGMNIYYNYSGTYGDCYPVVNNPDPYGGAWGYQTCTEMVMPYGSNGETDMFFVDPWNYTDFKAACAKRWKVVPQPNWAVVQWGGLNVQAGSNIFFSNGILDPYAGGGVLSSSVPSLPALYISQSAHHLDLRAPHPEDPVSIREARRLEKSYIESWIFEYINAKLDD